MTWQKTLIVLAVVLAMLALVATTIWTGRDAPATLSALLGSTLGLALGADALLRGKNGKDE